MAQALMGGQPERRKLQSPRRQAKVVRDAPLKNEMKAHQNGHVDALQTGGEMVPIVRMG